MTKLIDLPSTALLLPRVHGYADDFSFYTTVHNGWTTVASDSGSITVSDAAGGIVTLNPSDGTIADNDETYLKRTTETFLMAANKPFVSESYVKFTEANTDDANIWVGFKDAVAADSLVDNGAGMATSFSGFGFYKEDGQTLWSIIASLSTTQTTARLTAANSLDKTAKTAGGSYQRLGLVFQPKTSALADIEYYIDGVLVYKITDFTFTSATEMQGGFGVKNGSTNGETLLVDWTYAYQLR